MASVTVVVTTRDRPKLLARCLDALMAQTSPPAQVVVVDDAGVSPVSDLPDTVTVVRLDRQGGVSVARNVGLSLTTSDYVFFMDDDDWIAPDFFERQLATLKCSYLEPPVAVLGTRVFMTTSGRELLKITPASRVRGDDWLTDPQTGVENTLLAPAAVIHDMGGHDEQFVSWERDDFFQRLLARCSLDADPAALYFSEEDPRRSRMTNDWARLARGIDQTVAKHAAVITASPSVHARYRRAAAANWALAGHRKLALRRAITALRLQPGSSKSWRTFTLAILGARSYSAARRVRERSTSSRASVRAVSRS